MEKKRTVRMNASDRIESVLSAACELFARYSYDTVTTKQLASKVGCSEALLFRYFKNKDAIFKALLDEWDAGMSQTVELEIVDESPIKTLEKMYTDIVISKSWNKNRNIRPHLEQAILSRSGQNKTYAKILSKSPDVVINTIVPLIIQGQQAGEIRHGSPDEIAYVFWATLNGVLRLNSVFPERYPMLPFESISYILVASN